MYVDKKDKRTEIIVFTIVFIILISLMVFGMKGYGLPIYGTFKADFKSEIFEHFPKLNLFKDYSIGATDPKNGYALDQDCKAAKTAPYIHVFESTPNCTNAYAQNTVGRKKISSDQLCFY